MALGRGPVSGQQEIADEVPAVHFAQGIERRETASMHGGGRVVAGRVLLLHHPFERLYRAAAQGFPAEEGPFVELRAVAGREALEEVALVEAAGALELAQIAGLLERPGIDLQLDR